MQTDILREAFLARLGDDATFKALTGATAEDGRLFYRYEAAAVISIDKPCYAVYDLLPTNESSTGVAEPTFSLVIWTHSEFFETMKALRNRIESLFDRKTWTAGGVSARSRITLEDDIDQPEYGFVGRNLHLRIGALDLPT